MGEISKSRYNSAVEASIVVEKENKSLRAALEISISKRKEAEQAQSISQTTLVNIINEQNNMKESFAEEIRILKAKIRGLEK